MKLQELSINPKNEKIRIIKFLKRVFAEQKINNVVIGLSGGIDSTVSFCLLKEALLPGHIFVAHLYYFKPKFAELKNLVQAAKIPDQNIYLISIKKPVDNAAKLLGSCDRNQNRFWINRKRIEVSGEHANSRVRLGNIAARMRMIVLFDLAKQVNGLVCGTENKSENLLGYFTRFGDQASDIEPIEHLYKTQVYQLAQYLGAPDTVIKQNPTAGLWQGQTDEVELGFSYQEADQVLHLYFDKNKSLNEIKKLGLNNADMIIDWTQRNRFKQNVPYHL